MLAFFAFFILLSFNQVRTYRATFNFVLTFHLGITFLTEHIFQVHKFFNLEHKNGGMTKCLEKLLYCQK